MTLKTLSIYCLIATSMLLSGCGGVSQNDMRKYALHRKSDEELNNATPSMPPQNTPAVSTAGHANNGSSDTTVATNSTAAPSSQVAASAASVSVQQSGAPTTSSSETATAISDTRSPDPTLSQRERRRLTIENMTRIVRALEAYREATGIYPAFASQSTGGKTLYSWRVELLPYLGYQALYDQFHRDEPWNSPHNESLIAKIPAVYQSPGRCDTKTNYLVPVGNTTAFFGPRGQHPRRWEDGLENIVLLLEVDDSAAVTWTAPQDWAFDARQPDRDLGQLREDGFFAGWGGGTLALVPHGTAERDLRAMFTVDSGEAFQAGAVCQAASAEPGSTTSGTVSAAGAAQPVASSPTINALASIGPRDHHETPFNGVPASPLRGNERMSNELTDLARQAFSAGLDRAATNLALAAFLTGEPTSAVNYQWIPGLRRPATAIRVGVGLDYTGTNAASIRRQLGNPDEKSVEPASKLSSTVGDLAQPIFDRLQAATWITSPLAPAPNDRMPNNGPNVPVQWLGLADARTLVRAALLKDVDLVLMFDVEDKTTSNGTPSKAVTFSVWDTWNHRQIFKAPRVNYLRRKHAQNDPLYRDPIDSAVEKFGKFLSHDVQPQPLPSGIQPEHAARRIEGLARLARDNPLPLLCEMKFYRQHDLVSVPQLMSAYQQLLGTPAGAELLAGTAAEKRQAIAAWIPNVQLQLANVMKRSTVKDTD